MLPWTHAAFGYLLLLLVAAVLGRQLSRAELAAVIVGTQLPDIVDKPLAWWFDVLPSGRSLAHSLIVAVPLSVVVLAYAWHRSHPEVGVAFGLGYASHLIGDTYLAVIYWRPEEFTYLLWPLLPAYPYDDFVGFTDFLLQQTLTWQLLVFFVASATVGAVFFVHFARAPWYAPRSG
jgi:hypothetical protein